MESKNVISKKSGIFKKILEAIMYLLIVNGSYLAIMTIDISDKYTVSNFDAYRSIYIYITIGSFLIFYFNKIFDTFKLSKTENILVVITSTFMIGLFNTIIAFFGRSFAIPRSVIILGFIIQTILIVFIKIIFKLTYEKNKIVKNVAVFSDIDSREEAIETIFGTNKQSEKLCFITNLNNFDKSLLKNIDKVYIYDFNNLKHIDKYINICILKGIQICVVPQSYELAIANSKLYLVSDLPLLKIEQIGVSDEYRFIKRIMDIILSLFLIVILSPLMLIVTLSIYLTDGGAPIFKQKRVTKNNKIFTVYKFRTMIKNAEKESGAVWASKNDPRITKTGNILRKYWLDELPQLFNILMGDMSFVGPRPERPELIEEFVKELPDFRLRTNVKCGLTGYAQVMAKYETTPKYKLKFDLFYILNANLIFDLNIVMLTARKMFIRFIGHEATSYKLEELFKIWNLNNDNLSEDTVIFKY